MLLRSRRILFLLFSMSFFIVASSVLFYAYGYRFSIERGVFIYTGSLSLKTNVETVTIKIDGGAIPEKRLGLLNNSIHIAGLNPGEHMIEVEAPGYKSWSKKVVIQSGLTVEFWNIFLTEENYIREPVLSTERTLKIFPAPNGLFATVKQNGNRYSVDVLDITNEKNEEVFATTEALFTATLETNIEWAPESHKIIIPLIKDATPLYAVVDIKTKKTFFLNEATAISTPIHSPRWDAITKDLVFFLNQGSLYRFDTSDVNNQGVFAPAKLVAEHVAAYDLSGNKLYLLNNETGIVYRQNGSNADTSPEQITPSPVVLQDNRTYSLIAYDDTRLSVREKETGTLSVYNKRAENSPLKKLGGNIVGLQYSDDGKKLLFYSENEISVYFNQNWEAQPFRALDSVSQIARFSTPIKNVQWAEDYEHVIFSLGRNVKMIEIDNRDQRGLSDLLTLNTPPLELLPRFPQDALYIVESQANQDSNTVFRITLPQYATNIFGL